MNRITIASLLVLLVGCAQPTMAQTPASIIQPALWVGDTTIAFPEGPLHIQVHLLLMPQFLLPDTIPPLYGCGLLIHMADPDTNETYAVAGSTTCARERRPEGTWAIVTMALLITINEETDFEWSLEYRTFIFDMGTALFNVSKNVAVRLMRTEVPPLPLEKKSL